MKRTVIVLTLCAACCFARMAFAQDAKPSCAEDLEVVKLMYTTARSNNETYLELLARTEMKLKAAQAQLDAATKKLQALGTPPSVEKPK